MDIVANFFDRVSAITSKISYLPNTDKRNR